MKKATAQLQNTRRADDVDHLRRGPAMRWIGTPPTPDSSGFVRMLWRLLPPPMFFALRVCWRYVSCFIPGFIVSRFKRRPEVQGFGDPEASYLVTRLRNVDVFARTKLCRIMTSYGSDKGDHHNHNYTTVYSVLLEAFRDRPVKVFELGLGTNNPEIPSSMGINGRPGASLRAWREYLPDADVYGADIDRTVLFEEGRIKTFYCNQLDPMSIADLWSQPNIRAGVDIIIEDGLHTFEANTSFLEGSLEHLRPGGIYIVEDISSKMIARWRAQVETVYTKRYQPYEFVLARLPSVSIHTNNNLLIVRRPMEQDAKVSDPLEPDTETAGRSRRNS